MLPNSDLCTGTTKYFFIKVCGLRCFCSHWKHWWFPPWLEHFLYALSFTMVIYNRFLRILNMNNLSIYMWRNISLVKSYNDFDSAAHMLCWFKPCTLINLESLNSKEFIYSRGREEKEPVKSYYPSWVQAPISPECKSEIPNPLSYLHWWQSLIHATCSC